MPNLRPWVQEWVDALRSGKYEQGKLSLFKDGKYCCLGVLQELQDKATPGQCPYLSLDVATRLGITANGEFGLEKRTLVSLNDAPIPFPEIADKIEEIERNGLWVKP